MDTNAEFLKYCEARLTIVVAGKVGALRAVEGSAPGWRRLRTTSELVSLHEASHSAVAHALGFSVHGVFVTEWEIVGGKGFGGVCMTSRLPVDDVRGQERPDPRALPTDRHTAAELGLTLALVGTTQGWRGARGHIRVARERARKIINERWYQIQALAEALQERSDLGAAEVAAILVPR